MAACVLNDARGYLRLILAFRMNVDCDDNVLDERFGRFTIPVNIALCRR